jgi:hypothetical protein
MITLTFRKRVLRAAGLVGFGLLGFGFLLGPKVSAQTQPLQLDQQDMLFNTFFQLGINWQSYAGVPLSSTKGVPPGSDGRAPTVSMQSTNGGVTTAPPTTNQFHGFVCFGAIPTQTTTNLNGNANFAANAQLLNWPRGEANGTVIAVLRSAQVGAPYLGQRVSFLFGSVIPVPSTDETGVTLPQGTSVNYWLPAPYTTNGYTNAPYYWSPNARAVFATQSGGIDITWQKATPSLTPPSNDTNYVFQSGVYYSLYTQHYLVSGSAVKPPQKMYWTEGPFVNLGKPVGVPPAQVSDVNVVYNNSFPRRVAQAYQDPSQTPIVDTNMLQETRTLWFDSTAGQILAYNVEGRAFVELLGELNPDGVTRRFLGFEIVDVFKQATPVDVTANLGDRVPAYATLQDDSALLPSPVNTLSGGTFYYQQNFANSSQINLYATQETKNLNDFQVYWLQTGVAGLRWPFLFVRYAEVWPNDVRSYSHYLRPVVATDAQAQLTAVQLPTQNAPFIQYQDPLDQPRAKLTSTFAFYTFLIPKYPAHRTLLRYTVSDQVAFERVFSWLDTGIKSNALFASSVATNLMGWDPTNLVFNFGAQVYQTPYVVNQTVNVGDRISPPNTEIWNGTNYWAGYILQTNGTSFNPNAYIDPFVAGFDQANLGSIIPVNAIPGHNTLEVWWFRVNNADGSRGFLPTYWPSVVGNYTLQWPANARQIILASNAGSGPLDAIEAVGDIYFQNDPTRPGYNPNEEHALMLGGQAYALRDDLNITNVNGYSSAPYVLIEYMDSDSRPSMSAFKVRREAPEAGILFDYVVEAGTLLQEPMPLPLLPLPIVGSGASAVNYNVEPSSSSGDLPIGWSPSDASGPYGYYGSFTYQDRNHDYWVYRGLHAGLPPLQVGQYNANNNTFGPLPPATAVLNQPFNYFVHVSRRVISLTLSTIPLLPPGLNTQETTSGLEIAGVPTVAGSNYLTIIVQDTGDNTFATNHLSLNVVSNGTVVAQGPLAITSTNQYSMAVVTFTNRPPQLAQPPFPTNSFTMQFYYVTQNGFAWPGIANPPPSGSIVPYLRPRDPSGNFLGDATSSNTPSLSIVYRPVWPATPPTLYSAQSLTVPINGLAAVRGQSSVQLLYQQSIGLDIVNAPASAILNDPTRQKTTDLATSPLGAIPASVRTDNYQGLIYFPDLPPHLANRFWFDPHRGKAGALVLGGQFVNDPVGLQYLLLNVLRDSDLAAVKALCPSNDTINKPNWDAAIDALSTTVQTFYENPQVPGTYIPNPNLTTTVGVGDLTPINSSDTAVDSYALSASGPGTGYISYITGNGRAFTPIGNPITVYVARVSPPLFTGEIKVLPSVDPLNQLITFQHTSDVGGRFSDYQYDWRIMPPVNGFPPPPPYENWVALTNGIGVPRYTLGGAGIQALSDNWIVMRYRSINPIANPADTNWSAWTSPQLAEGWIKRVLGGINPIDQRTTDLFNNQVNTTVSIIAQAGHRWEGDIALNLSTINNYGLIEIYETVLKRGESLSINAGINYGPANDALLLAAGYLSDLYTYLGNEAWANSLNPTIGVSGQVNNIATSKFVFEGETASLLEQNLDLLRGRDDTLLPGVTTPPVYNRLYWNFTQGIIAGEVLYELNYDIQDENGDGVIDAADAAIDYPQGHGDAYGHYLTALTGYYSLLMNPNFDWVPTAEAVSVLGLPVSVNYQNERKFAAAAGAVARTGEQIFGLTWRQDYQPGGTAAGWGAFSKNRVNAQRSYSNGGTAEHVTEYWGMDHWAARVGLGDYINWVVGNAILPPVDPDPTHTGIQKVDRTTVPELAELPASATALQTDMDNAEGGNTPLGLPQNAIPFDINPYQVTGANPTTHFEQIYARALGALNNALVAFNAAASVTQVLRAGNDSQASFQASVAAQELAFTNQLVGIYGTPYPDDEGPGQTYAQGYNGPDLIHYMYVDRPDETVYGAALTNTQTFKVDTTQLPADWQSVLYSSVSFATNGGSPSYQNYIQFQVGSDGFFDKPANFTSERASPGSIQQAIATYILAHDALTAALGDAVDAKVQFDKAVAVFNAQVSTHNSTRSIQGNDAILTSTYNAAQAVSDIVQRGLNDAKSVAAQQAAIFANALPKSIIVGLADGGDELAPARAAIQQAGAVVGTSFSALDFAAYTAIRGLQVASQLATSIDTLRIADMNWDLQLQQSVNTLGNQLITVQGKLNTINADLFNLSQAKMKYDQLVAQGEAIQQQRQVFRQKAASTIQGYRIQDAAFRLFQNEDLQRYQTLFNVAAQYAFMAAQAYDYETGLLNTDAGKAFVSQIVGAQALGVINNGLPLFTDPSSGGDPGLASALAGMNADWGVLKGRLGFNNPDGYGTIVSLRSENFRILPGSAGSTAWQDVLQQARVPDLLADPDVRRYCMQIDDGSGLPVPGIILNFSTVIANGLNLFGLPLAAGDHDFSSGAFATKIFSVGVDFDGYIGMDNPTSVGVATNTTDPNALAATPYIYLIPVGTDSMRTPPLGDTSTVRSWNVADIAVPMPINVSDADFSSNPFYQANDSLSEPLYQIRKDQAFRPVSTTAAFTTSIYSGNGLTRSQFSNTRLIGRSIWNSKWKIVIPGRTLLSDANQGLDRFSKTVTDVKLYFITYSYSGN